MLKVAVTGGIGSGKTTICKIFETLNIPIFYADLEAKTIVNKDKDVKEKLKLLLGNEAYNDLDEIDRNFVAKKIFENKEYLSKINEIVHHKVQENFGKFAKDNSKAKYIIEEAAIIFETGRDKDFDKIITVIATKDTRIKRIKQRDGKKEKDILQIINNQMSDEEKIKKSDFVINNDGKVLVIPQVLEVNRLLL